MMRRVRSVSVVLSVLAGLAVPGGADAQIPPAGPVAQDLSIAGEIVGRDGMKVRTVRLSVTNLGPGAFDGASAQIALTALEATIRSAPSGCGQTFMGYRCDLGTHLEPGETRSVDIVYEYTSTAYRFTSVQADIFAVDPGFSLIRGDANPANNRVFVDLDPERGPPAVALGLSGSSFARHGAAARSIANVRNTGGTRLLDIRVRFDRCPDSAQTNETGQTQLRSPGGLFITCDWTFPSHVKGDDRISASASVTATAPNGQVVTATAAWSTRFFEAERKCGSFRARKRTYDTKTTAPDFTCAATRRALRRCLKRRKKPKGFVCARSPTKSVVYVYKPKRVPNDRMIAVARR